MAERANSLSGAQWLKNSFSIWRGFARDKDTKGHPAPFPIALVEQILDCYAPDGDGTVLDIYAGSGSTLIAALKANMLAVGIDLNPEYREVFVERAKERKLGKKWNYFVDSAENIAQFLDEDSVDICITSPPYWNILRQSRTVDKKQSKYYTEDPNDLGNLEQYDDFVRLVCKHLSDVELILKPGGYCVVNVMDLRKKSEFYPLHADIAKTLLKVSAMTLEDIIIWDRQSDYNSMRPLGYPYKFIINKVHEYLLIFRKRR